MSISNQDTSPQGNSLMPDPSNWEMVQGSFNLRLHLMPKINGVFLDAPSRTGEDGIPWGAILYVWAADIARLMREGFHFTSANLVRERGAMMPPSGDWMTESILGECGCDYMRRFVLKDLGRLPFWEAMLVVWARDIKTLADFRISDDPNLPGPHLSPTRDMIYKCAGYNKSGELIYCFDFRNPDDSFNTIYDDKPLDGWWPWPVNVPGVSDKTTADPRCRKVRNDNARPETSVNISRFHVAGPPPPYEDELRSPQGEQGCS